MMRRMVGIVLVLAALMAVTRRAVAQPDGNGLQTIHAKVGEIPILVVAPAETKGRMLIIWLTGFSGSKEKVEAHLREFAKHGFVGLSFDPYQHGERRIEPNEALSKRVVGNIRRFFWPILARTAEETPKVIDWAIKTFKVRKEVGMGGISMGGGHLGCRSERRQAHQRRLRLRRDTGLDEAWLRRASGGAGCGSAGRLRSSQPADPSQSLSASSRHCVSERSRRQDRSL
jgi:hypothetical protein